MKMGEDIMYSILETLLTGLIDPLIWMKSMSTLGLKRSRIQYVAAFIICYILVIGKSFTSTYISMGAISTLLTIILAVYLFAATIFLFEGKFREKVMYVCMLCSITLATELIVMGSVLFFKPDALEIIMHDGLINLICTLIAKLLLLISCYWLFSRKNLKLFYENEEMASLLLVSFVLVVDVMFRYMSNKHTTNAMLLFAIIEILFLWYILSTLLALKRKEGKIYKLNQEACSNLDRTEMVKDIDHFKHEFSTYAFMMKNLWHCKEYDKLEEYMDNVFKDVPKVELIYEHPNFAVRIIISFLMQMAKKAGIMLHIQIDIDEFGMEDQDICAIFHSLVLEGLQEAVKTSYHKPSVSLKVMSSNAGYVIQCTSDCISQSNKEDNELDEVMNGIVETHNGKVTRNYIKGKRDRNCLAKVSVFIPLEL